MTVNRPSTRSVLDDIRSGMDTEALMQKYRLSPAALQNLFADMVERGLLKRTDRFTVVPAERAVNAREVVKDIRAGLSRSELMEKHALSLRALQGLVSILIDTQIVSRDDLYADLFFEHDAVHPDAHRALDRYYLDFETPLYDASRPDVLGRVFDITEDGVGAIGLECWPDENKTLVVLGDALGEVAPFEFEAKCRWFKVDDSTGQYRSGFQITYISPRNKVQLQKLIELVTFSG